MKTTAVILILLLSLQLTAQTSDRIKLGGIAGYAFYPQNELKAVNRNILVQLPFKAQIVDDFEPAVYFGGYIQYELFNRFWMGPAYEYQSTGSRLGTRDYSGSYSFDQYIHAHQIGLKLDYFLLDIKSFVINAQVNGGVYLTNWKMESSLELAEAGEYAEHQLDKFKGHNWHLSPGLNLGYRLSRQLTLTATAAYSFDIARKYKYLNNTGYEVLHSPGWSGFKFAAGLEFRFIERAVQGT